MDNTEWNAGATPPTGATDAAHGPGSALTWPLAGALRDMYLPHPVTFSAVRGIRQQNRLNVPGHGDRKEVAHR
jgi:hypothetical protein